MSLFEVYYCFQYIFLMCMYLWSNLRTPFGNLETELNAICDHYTSGIYAEGDKILVLPLVRSSVLMFVLPFVCYFPSRS